MRILVVGGGYVGMYTALRLQRKLKQRLKSGDAEIVVVTPEPYMTYQPFLPEAAAGSISPRHVVVPLRRVLNLCTIVIGEAERVDHAKRTATVTTLATAEDGTGALEIGYDEIVIAPGSVSRTLPVPGLADFGIGFKTVEEAIGLRNHVIEQMDIASATRDPAIRDAALTFVFVGGGYAGVEALAELEDMARYTARYYHNIKPTDLRWASSSRPPTASSPRSARPWGRYAVWELRGRSVDVRLETRLETCEDRVAVLSDGSRFPTARWCGPRASNRHRSCPQPTCPSPNAADFAVPPPSASRECRTPGPRATPPPSPTSPPPSRARRPPPTPSTRSARRRCSPTTSWRRSTAAR
ncbi:hypothetical protein SMICM304S_10740 [Streptomyces microflavus]